MLLRRLDCLLYLVLYGQMSVVHIQIVAFEVRLRLKHDLADFAHFSVFLLVLSFLFSWLGFVMTNKLYLCFQYWGCSTRVDLGAQHLHLRE